MYVIFGQLRLTPKAWYQSEVWDHSKHIGLELFYKEGYHLKKGLFSNIIVINLQYIPSTNKEKKHEIRKRNDDQIQINLFKLFLI